MREVKPSLFFEFVFSIFQLAITGVFCIAVASEKKLWLFWLFILNFLFGFVALIAVVCLPDREFRKFIRNYLRETEFNIPRALL